MLANILIAVNAVLTILRALKRIQVVVDDSKNCMYLRPMDFKRRLRLYGFGFVLGLAIVFGMFGSRSCTTPNEIKMQELVHQQFNMSDKALCKLKYLKKNELLLKVELRHFEINYDVSSPRNKPCGEYYILPKPEHSNEYRYNLVIYDCDTISTIRDINITSANTCTCQ